MLLEFGLLTVGFYIGVIVSLYLMSGKSDDLQ